MMRAETNNGQCVKTVLVTGPTALPKLWLTIAEMFMSPAVRSTGAMMIISLSNIIPQELNNGQKHLTAGTTTARWICFLMLHRAHCMLPAEAPTELITITRQ